MASHGPSPGAPNVRGSPSHCNITGMDVCLRKPLVVTCGVDCTVRIWNHLTKSQDVVKAFPDEPFSVAFHPTGFHVLVGFKYALSLPSYSNKASGRYHVHETYDTPRTLTDVPITPSLHSAAANTKLSTQLIYTLVSFLLLKRSYSAPYNRDWPFCRVSFLCLYHLDSDHVRLCDGYEFVIAATECLWL